MSNLKWGPKMTPLGEVENISSIERWKQNLLYLLRLNDEFKPFLRENVDFGKKKLDSHLTGRSVMM